MDGININDKTAEELLELYFDLVNEDDEDTEKLFTCLQAAADKGSPEAWAELGACYLGGLGVEQDEAKANNYLEKAALRNVANAQMNLYILMRDRAQTDEERKNAFYWLNQALENKVSSALFEIGSLYYNGNFYKQDFLKAAGYYRQSADAGSSEALAMLGVMHQLGQGLEKDMSKAVEYFVEAAEAGSMTGMYNLGNSLMGGLGIDQDYAEAMSCFQTLTDLDDPFFETPDMKDKKTRSDVALIHHQTQVYNMIYPMAHHNIAVMHQQGLGTEVDAGAALYHYMHAAENGYGPSCLQAGILLYTGEGTESDPDKAFEYLSVALDSGIPEAKIYLGIMYYCGEGVEQDTAKGIAFLDELIAMGNVSAMQVKNNLLNSGQ